MWTHPPACCRREIRHRCRWHLCSKRKSRASSGWIAGHLKVLRCRWNAMARRYENRIRRMQRACVRLAIDDAPGKGRNWRHDLPLTLSRARATGMRCGMGVSRISSEMHAQPHSGELFLAMGEARAIVFARPLKHPRAPGRLEGRNSNAALSAFLVLRRVRELSFPPLGIEVRASGGLPEPRGRSGGWSLGAHSLRRNEKTSRRKSDNARDRPLNLRHISPPSRTVAGLFSWTVESQAGADKMLRGSFLTWRL
jgi:hypothetical protein